MATSGLPVSITVDASSASVCSKSGAVVTFVAAGRCTVDANQPGDATYNSAAQVQQSNTVARRSQTIAFTSANPSPELVGDTYVPTATSPSGLLVAITVDAGSSGVCSISSGEVTFDAAGTCTIDANQAGNATYDPAAQVQQSITIARRSQTVSFTSANPSPATVGGTYTPTATSTSGLPVAITVDASSTGVCSPSGALVTFDAVGTCTIDVDQAGDATYDSAPQAQQSITVNAPATSQGLCESEGGTFSTATLWTCSGLPAAASNDWSPLNAHCLADGGVAGGAVQMDSGVWNYTCYAGALYFLLLAAGGAIAGAIWAAFHG
jgi:hypothetical protein